MILTGRTIPTTTIGSRDPVGRKYLATEDGKILTTESGAWIIAIDNTPTQLTNTRQYTGQTWDDLGSQTWADQGSKTWNDLYTGIAPTILTGRIIP